MAWGGPFVGSRPCGRRRTGRARALGAANAPDAVRVAPLDARRAPPSRPPTRAGRGQPKYPSLNSSSTSAPRPTRRTSCTSSEVTGSRRARPARAGRPAPRRRPPRAGRRAPGRRESRVDARELEEAGEHATGERPPTTTRRRSIACCGRLARGPRPCRPARGRAARSIAEVRRSLAQVSNKAPQGDDHGVERVRADARPLTVRAPPQSPTSTSRIREGRRGARAPSPREAAIGIGAAAQAIAEALVG
jgi:hypothetical protein